MFRGACTCVMENAPAVKAAEREFSGKGLRPRLVPSVSKAAPKAAAGFGAKVAGKERAELGLSHKLWQLKFTHRFSMRKVPPGKQTLSR